VLKASVAIPSNAMVKDECRESRAVPFTPDGAVWAAAAAGAIRQSVGQDVDEQGRLLPSPPKGGTLKGLGLTPYQRQQSPFASKAVATWGSVGSVRDSVSLPSRVQRIPLAPLEGNDVAVRVLSAEVLALELQTVALSKRVKMQDSLIKGLCTEVARRAPPAVPKDNGGVGGRCNRRV